MKIYDKDMYHKEQNIKSIIFIIVVFLLGFFAGIMVNRLEENQQEKQQIENKIERNIERQAKNLAKNLAKNKSKSSLKNKHYAAGNTGDSYEVIRKLRSNSASLYDYLEYALNDTDRDRLKKMIDMYYISRFRGDTLTNSEVESLVK